MPLTHAVLSVPVELVCREALALVAAHCVYTEMLAASVVDAALVGVCEAKHFPVTTVTGTFADSSTLERKRSRREAHNCPLSPTNQTTALRKCAW